MAWKEKKLKGISIKYEHERPDKGEAQVLEYLSSSSTMLLQLFELR